jgi:hypothetical protein
MQDSTPASTAERVAPLALLAVDQFMVDHQLPAYRSKSITPGGRAVRLTLDDNEAWATATNAEYIGADPLHSDGGRFVVTTEVGTIPSPIGDVTVRLCVVQAVDTGRRNLALVGGESA